MVAHTLVSAANYLFAKRALMEIPAIPLGLLRFAGASVLLIVLLRRLRPPGQRMPPPELRKKLSQDESRRTFVLGHAGMKRVLALCLVFAEACGSTAYARLPLNEEQLTQVRGMEDSGKVEVTPVSGAPFEMTDVHLSKSEVYDSQRSVPYEAIARFRWREPGAAFGRSLLVGALTGLAISIPFIVKGCSDAGGAAPSCAGYIFGAGTLGVLLGLAAGATVGERYRAERTLVIGGPPRAPQEPGDQPP